MSEVSLTIGGKSYRVACADGQEQQLSHLATMVDKKFTQMQNNLASSEAQNLLFAAILLADELNEITTALDRPVHEKENDLSVLEGKLDEAQQLQSILKEENNRLSSENENLKAQLVTGLDNSTAQNELFNGEATFSNLEVIADLLENCAETLESRVSTSYLDDGGTAGHEPF